MKNKTKILIADDEEAVLDITAKNIEEEGYDVVTAHDGEDAWEKIVKESPDVIILDLTMPKKDGFEVLKDLRQNPPGQKWQPVIIVSARTDLEAMRKGFSLEADHYLTKPCSLQEIIKAIKLMLSLIPQRKSQSEITND